MPGRAAAREDHLEDFPALRRGRSRTGRRTLQRERLRSESQLGREDPRKMPEIAAQRMWVPGLKPDIASRCTSRCTTPRPRVPGSPPHEGGEGKFRDLAERFFRILSEETTFAPTQPLHFAQVTTTAGMTGRMTVVQGLYHDFKIPTFLMEQRIANNPKLGPAGNSGPYGFRRAVGGSDRESYPVTANAASGRGARYGEGVYREYMPPPHLARYVECFWSVEPRADAIEHLILPDGCEDIVFLSASGTVAAVGTMTRAKKHIGAPNQFTALRRALSPIDGAFLPGNTRARAYGCHGGSCSPLGKPRYTSAPEDYRSRLRPRNNPADGRRVAPDGRRRSARQGPDDDMPRSGTRLPGRAGRYGALCRPQPKAVTARFPGAYRRAAEVVLPHLAIPGISEAAGFRRESAVA